MNTTVNGSSCSSPFNLTAAKIGQIFAYCLIFVASLLGNSFTGIIVYKTQTLRKPINFFIVTMAMSDLLFPIYLFPSKVTHLYANSWLISGPLGQALCTLVIILANVSTIAFVQSLILIAVDRFGAVKFPLRSPLISSKLCPFFIVATWIIAMAVCSLFLFAYTTVEYPGGLQYGAQWNEAFGESFSAKSYFLALFVVFLLRPNRHVDHTLLHHRYQAEVTEEARRTINHRCATTSEKEQKSVKDGHCYRVGVCTIVGAPEYWQLTIVLCMGQFALWLL